MEMFKKTALCFLVTSFLLNSFSIVQANKTDIENFSDFKTQDKAEILIKYKSNADSKKIKSRVKSSKVGNTNIEIAEVIGQENIDKVITELENSPEVEYIQPNYELYASCNSKLVKVNEPRFNEQWGLLNKGQVINGQKGKKDIDIDIIEAWKKTKGDESIVVGILDNGAYINHPEIRDNIFINKSEIPGNNVDEDNNGYIDDINGYNFRDNTNQVCPTVSEEVYGTTLGTSHGTSIAGIICANENDVGIVGIASKVKILPLKFMEGTKGRTSDAIRAIEYAKSMGVKIINCSFAGTNYNQALKDVIEANSDILFVCSTGNNGNSSPVYPASFCLPNTISVASNDNKGKLSPFSNYGDTVEISAPGQDILSIIGNDGYAYIDGTSFATPFVTATAALVMSRNKNIKPDKIKKMIINGVSKRSNLKGQVTSKGILNAKSALKK